MIARLLGPLEAVNAALDSPATPHRRRAMPDVVAVLLTRCAETARTFLGWTDEEWFHLLGRTQAEFVRHAPAWAGDEVRPYLAAHAYLLGGFKEFHRLGSFQRLTLAWRIFGRDRVNGEVTRLRTVLAVWAAGSAGTRTPCGTAGGGKRRGTAGVRRGWSGRVVEGSGGGGVGVVSGAGYVVFLGCGGVGEQGQGGRGG